MTIALQLCRCSGRDGFTRLQDTDTFICVKCEVPMVGYEIIASGGIAYFRDGPMDKNVYEIKTLLGSEARVLPIIEYAWTPEIVTSPTTGKTARVWQWKGAEAALPPEPEIQPQEEEVAQTTSADGTVTVDQIRERREALGLSRPQLAEKADGITAAQISRIETSGKRPKDGAIDKIVKALEHFEKDAGKKKPADAPLA